MSRREPIEIFLACSASATETIEQRLRGVVFRVAKFSAYSHKARTATKQPPLRYRHETDMPSRTAHVRRGGLNGIRQSPEFQNSVKHFTSSDGWWSYHGAEPEGCIDA